MISFYCIWSLLNPQGEYKRRRRGCEKLWAGYDEQTCQRIYENIRSAKERGEWVNPNPYFAIEDVVVKTISKQPSLPRTLTYAEYYRKYGTTEPRDGWKMENPTGNQVIYVKTVL